MSDSLHFLRRKELYIIIFIFMLALITYCLVNQRSYDDAYAIVKCGDVIKEISLKENGEYSFNGINAVFEVDNHKIRVKDSICKDKICENTGYIGTPGQSIICVPEKISVIIKSDSDKENEKNADIIVG